MSRDLGGVEDLTRPRPTGPCDWCDLPAVGSVPILKRVPGKRNARVLTGMNVYFCNRHQGTAERHVAEPL